MAKIANGCILLARKTLDSEIWTNKPAWWLKVWIYILMKVNHIDIGRFKRGQGFFRAEGIQEACSLQLEGITTKTIHNLIKWLKSTTQITTQKTTRGMIITVCNYDEYQDLINYRNDTENDTENEIETKQERHYKQECKECNKYSFVENSIEFQLTHLLLQKLIKLKPDFKRPNLQSWAKHIDYMMRLDSRNPDEIRSVIEWIHANGNEKARFWQGVILSTQGLRKKYDQLVIQMNNFSDKENTNDDGYT